jgi:putative sigma-54 modulation protein
MSLNFAFRQIQATDALKNHITKRVEKFRKFVTYPIDIYTRLSLEKMYHCVEISLTAEHRTLVAVAKTKDLYESIDLACKKIESQLKKERERKKGHGSAHTIARPTALRLASDIPAELPHGEKKRKRAS